MDWESHLVSRAQAGEKVAFELLMDEHRDALRKIAMRLLRNSDDAHDAVQDTFIKAYRAIHSFKPGRPVLPWLARICANCCVDVVRARRLGTEDIEKYEFALVSPGDTGKSVEDRYDASVVQASLARLPRHYRRILEMRHYEDMEVSEIATAISRPEGTVKSWLFRARAMLRKELEPTWAA